MEPKMLLDKKVKDEIKNMFSWIKKSKKVSDLSSFTPNRHCSNYSTHGCLSCDKCWGEKNKTQK